MSIKFPYNCRVGYYYEVPHIRIFYARKYTSDTQEWMNGILVPVNSELHDDTDTIGIDKKHYHIDWRFLDEKYWDHFISCYTRQRYKPKVSHVVMLASAGVAFDFISGQNTECYYDRQENKIIYLRKKCLRRNQVLELFSDQYYLKAHATRKENWIPRLQAKFAGCRLTEKDGQFLCPHRGVPVEINKRKKILVCPGHFLQYNSKTLTAIAANQLSSH